MKGRIMSHDHREQISRSSKGRAKTQGRCRFCGIQASLINLQKHGHNQSAEQCANLRKNTVKRKHHGISRAELEYRLSVWGSAAQGDHWALKWLQYVRLRPHQQKIKKRQQSAPAFARLFDVNKALIFDIQRNRVDWKRVALLETYLTKHKRLHLVEQWLKQAQQSGDKYVWVSDRPRID